MYHLNKCFGDNGFDHKSGNQSPYSRPKGNTKLTYQVNNKIFKPHNQNINPRKQIYCTYSSIEIQLS